MQKEKKKAVHRHSTERLGPQGCVQTTGKSVVWFGRPHVGIYYSIAKRYLNLKTYVREAMLERFTVHHLWVWTP